MVDLYLQALMRGEISAKPTKSTAQENVAEKDRFDVEIERQIDAYVATLYLDEDPSQNQFNTPQMKRSKTKAEMKESLKLSELSSYLETGYNLLSKEGSQFLEKDAYESMIANLNQIESVLTTLDLAVGKKENFQKSLKITDATIQSIFKIAVEKFNQDHYGDALVLFVMLTTFVPEDADYWYRAGMSAHRCEKFNLATKLYSTAISLDTQIIGAHIFNIDCLIKCELDSEAAESIAKFENIKESISIDNYWDNLLKQLKSLLKDK